MTNRRALLVEGYADTLLARGVLSKTGIANVDVFPPKEQGAPSNGISNVIGLLPVMLAKVQGGDFDSFAIMVDADYQGINGGFVPRRIEVETKLLAAGYTRQATGVPTPFGDVYLHPTQIPIHLAILPDHANDGMVEHILATSVSPGIQATLFTYVQACIAGLPNILFNQALHMRKAEIATLLAWQKSPGCDAGVGIRNNVFNLASPSFSPLVNWLKIVFP